MILPSESLGGAKPVPAALSTLDAADLLYPRPSPGAATTILGTGARGKIRHPELRVFRNSISIWEAPPPAFSSMLTWPQMVPCRPFLE